ncbi:MAG: DMT family transporter [Kiritimatiellia bacterium]|nr:DMT family transporter [Kiritimatiellia bacterium]
MILNAKTTGLLALLGGVALFSTVEVAAKIIGPNALPFQMVFVRFFITGVILLALSLPAFLKNGLDLKLPDFGLFALNGAVGVAVALSLFHLAILVFEKAASCAVVFSANPIFVIILARFINNEPWNVTKWAALSLGAAGVALFAWESGAFTLQSLAALGIMTASAFFFALSICISRRLVARYGVFILMGFSALFGSLMIFPFALASTLRQGAGGLGAAWLPLLYITLAGTTLAYGLYYYGLRHCTAFQASMMFFLKPVLASIFAAVILKEHINSFMAGGSLLIISGLAVTVGSYLKTRS